MGILVSYDRKGYEQGVSYPAMELAIGGFITAIDVEKVSVGYDPATNNMTVQSVRET